MTTKAKRPDIQSPSYREILKELQEMMGSVNDIRETNRGSPLFNHLSALSEGVSVLGWITVEPKPADYVTEILGSTQFYGNRVIKEYKEKSVFLRKRQLDLAKRATEIEHTLNGHRRSIRSSNHYRHM